jgi:uracil-DNA glycosylase
MMSETLFKFNLTAVHPSWQPCITAALATMDREYLKNLAEDSQWLPGPEKIFNAFSLPMEQTKYVLFGESPYPRAASANGYAFWDAAVTDIWSNTGLSKPVNRATSLRNIIKMLLITEGVLSPDDATQPAIAALDKSQFVQTNTEFFNNFLNHGFLLLNATPILQLKQVRKDAQSWAPFIKTILHTLFKQKPDVQLILLGNIANSIDKLIDHAQVKKFYAEHPYNISFINNETVKQFFQPLHLLRR